MKEKLGTVEARFADIVWEHAPLSSAELVKLCAEALDWKRTTTYTVLKKCCDGGLFCLDGGTVTVLVPREDYYAAQSEKFVRDAFSGSLPAFIAAFTKRKNLTPEEIAEIRAMIDNVGEKP
ncbi:MAG: BlaI/MecI/CopY family transcriptional regulator [Clostridia bacterium]|nr:BlaI/MecI/CopY family transcriptional regulator [Clostridia bacterium]